MKLRRIIPPVAADVRRLIPKLAWLAILVLLLPPLHAQLSRFVRGKNFKAIEYHPPVPGLKHQTNHLKNLLSGAEGQYLTNGLVRITKSRLENYPSTGIGTNLVALSPESFFDPDTKIITSTGRLDVTASDGRMTLRGETGYLFSMTNSSFVVSNRVRAFIHGDLLPSARP